MARIATLVLAGGKSRRFGADKRQTPLPTGRTMLVESIRVACAASADVLVVLGEGEEAFAADVARRAAPAAPGFICATGSALGMAHSLVAGLRHVLDKDAVMVALADLPYIKPSTHRAVAAYFEAHVDSQPIVAPVHAGKRGHPVLFHRRYFPEICDLTGEEGAKSVIAANADRLVELSVDDPGILRDVDRPQDLAPKPLE